MKRINLILVLFIGFLNPAFSQALKSYFSHSAFYSASKGPFIETNLTVLGNSMVFKPTKGKKESASVNIIITFSDANGMVAAGNNYNLITPEVEDTAIRPNIVDMQRYFLKPGKYLLEISMSDNNSEKKEKFSSKEDIEVKYNAGQINMSDIELIESFSKTEKPTLISKSGYDMVPYSLNYFAADQNKLNFYCEAYGTDTVLGVDKKVAMVYYIENNETLQKMEGFFGVSRQKSQKVNVLFAQIDISKLMSGNYNLVVEVRDEKGTVEGQKKFFFQRVNANKTIDLKDIAAIDPNATFASHYTDLDSIKEFIRSLWPISSPVERDWQESQVKNGDLKVMQQYFYAFWNNRNPDDPEGDWIKYYKQVLYVNKVFPCGKQKGYYTDRGRVYLQYGPPSSQQQVPNEPDTYPYEVWQYYTLKDPITQQQQNNRKFVFWNKDMDGTCFKILHSDVRGEMRNDRWQVNLKQRSQYNSNLDVETPTQTYGSGQDDLFNNPR